MTFTIWAHDRARPLNDLEPPKKAIGGNSRLVREFADIRPHVPRFVVER